jgi:hypothetical protein
LATLSDMSQPLRRFTMAGRSGQHVCCQSRVREARVICGRPLACRRSPAEEWQGPRGPAVDFRSHRPLRTRPTDQRKAAAERVSRGGAGGIGTRSGLDAGGATPHNPRLPRPDATTATSTVRSPCRAPAARRARGAKRERALAGTSGGASGPCRPGLKSYRKFSPARNARLV